MESLGASSRQNSQRPSQQQNFAITQQLNGIAKVGLIPASYSNALRSEFEQKEP
jgi:hypothetical protein